MHTAGLFVASLFLSFTAFAQGIASCKITDVASYYNRKNDSVYVINFWATFCKPCVAEIPYLQRIAKQYKKQKVRLLLVSLDLPSFYPAKVESFAKKNKFTAEVLWLNESDADYFCPVIDSSWSGAIPATVFVNASTGYKKFIESEMTEERFEKELRDAIEERGDKGVLRKEVSSKGLPTLEIVLQLP